jgi:hypothetical protein
MLSACDPAHVFSHWMIIVLHCTSQRGDDTTARGAPVSSAAVLPKRSAIADRRGGWVDAMPILVDGMPRTDPAM